MLIQLPGALLAAAVAVLSAVPGLAAAGAVDVDRAPAALARGGLEGELELEARGEIHDIRNKIEAHGQCGLDFCTTFLHIQPRTTYVTRTVSVTGSSTVPSTTVSRTTVVTRTALPAITRTNSQLSVVAVTPTVAQTIVKPVPSTSTVKTITSLVTRTKTKVVATVTSFTTKAPVPRRYDEHVPSYLRQYCDGKISKACSPLVSTKTCTKTRTVTTTKPITKGAATKVITKTLAVTPTTTVTVVRTSKSTASAVTSTIKVTSSSLVPATATVVGTKFNTVTRTATVLLPVPSTSSKSTTTTTTTTSSTTLPTDTPTSTSTTTTTTETTTSTTTTTDTTTSTTTTTTTTTPTPTAPASVQGYFRLVKQSDQSFYGYIAEGNGAYGAGAITTSLDDALLATVPASILATGGGPINFPLVNPQTYAFLGGTQLANSGNGDLATGSSNYVTVANVDQVPEGQRSNEGTSYGTGITQSQIWYINASDGRVSASWVNSDGNTVTIPNVLCLQSSSYIYLSADPQTFKATYGSFDVVVAYFVPSA